MRKFLISLLLLTSICAFSQSLPSHAQMLAGAIARAEGFYVPGSRPNRLHNPGDIRTNFLRTYAGQIGVDPSGYVIFRDDRAGFLVLQTSIDRIENGNSSKYSLHMTIAAFARVYVGGPGWHNWAVIVAKTLGVTPDTTLEDYLDNPSLTAQLGAR